MHGSRWTKVTMRMRHYLTEVRGRDHRRAIALLVLSDHPFAVEQLRRTHRYRSLVPRAQRLCRDTTTSYARLPVIHGILKMVSPAF